MLEITIGDATDHAALEVAWRDLEERSEASFFQSWGWIGCWLQTLPSGIAPKRLQVDLDGRTIGLALLTPSPQTRHKLLHTRGLFLHETGRPNHDSLTMEHNGFLTERGTSALVSRHALQWLCAEDHSWDELFLSGLDTEPDQDYTRIAGDLGLQVHTRDRKRGAYVDLQKVRAGGGDYLAILGSNTRYQIRRTLRLYEKRGGLAFEVAQDAGQAREYFAGLKELHQIYWRKRGYPGSFANDFFEEFHTTLIRERFAAGEIQLARVSVAEEPIGFLYNFARLGRVYSYQSGFKYERDAKIKPGLACHYLCIEYNLLEGASCYDFLAGENQQKMTMSTDYYDMAWLVLQRPKPKLLVERALRRLKHLVLT